MPQFKYEGDHVPGRPGTLHRWRCPECGREGDWQLSKLLAKQDARRTHGYGRCPGDDDLAAARAPVA